MVVTVARKGTRAYWASSTVVVEATETGVAWTAAVHGVAARPAVVAMAAAGREATRAVAAGPPHLAHSRQCPCQRMCRCLGRPGRKCDSASHPPSQSTCSILLVPTP